MEPPLCLYQQASRWSCRPCDHSGYGCCWRENILCYCTGKDIRHRLGFWSREAQWRRNSRWGRQMVCRSYSSRRRHLGCQYRVHGALGHIWRSVCKVSKRHLIRSIITEGHGLVRRTRRWLVKHVGEDSEVSSQPLESALICVLILRSQTRELQTATSQVLGFLVCDVFISVACLVVAFCYSWKLSLVLLGTIPISVLALGLISQPLEPAIERQKAELSRASKLAHAAISAIDLVKVYNGSDQEVWQYLQTIRQAMKHYLIQARCNCLQMSYVKFWMINLFVVGFWFAVYLVNRGETTPGNALTTFYAALTAFEAVESVGPQWLVLAKGMSAGQSLQAITLHLQHGRQVRNLDGHTKPTTCSGDIEVHDVSCPFDWKLQNRSSQV